MRLRVKRVLVADDQQELREILEEILSQEGCEVYTARDGREAVQLAPSIQPQLVFLDVCMPRLNGWEAYLALHEMLPDVEVVMMTGYEVEKAAAKAQALGLGFLAKPFDLDRVRRLLDAGTE